MFDDLDPNEISEVTLDPDDWDEFASLARRMVDETLDHLRTLRQRPAWTNPPATERSEIRDEPLPFSGQGELAVYSEYKDRVRPYRNGNLDPRFFGWVQGNGTPLGMMADMLASGINAHLAGFNQTPVDVELKVIDWLREIMGFPLGSTGLLLSGGSMANLTGLTVARNAMAGYDVRKLGLHGDRPRMTVYGSDQTHSWARKAVELLGLGSESYRQVPSTSDLTMDLAALAKMVSEDRENGGHPFAVLATAGTVNTGATDDLDAIADFCREESMWFHVDGAFGALAAVSPRLKHLVKGLERADSVAFDLHKWMYQPFEIACLLVRDGEKHRQAFRQNVSYLATTTRGVNAGGQVFADLGIELTRGFKALKAWMSIKAHGMDKFAQIIEQNVAQAQYLARMVDAHPFLERMAEVPLNIVCFRYLVPGISQEAHDTFNEELLVRLQEQGVAIPSSTILNGCFCIRVCIVNHRTRLCDIDSLMEGVVKIGNELVASHDPMLFS